MVYPFFRSIGPFFRSVARVAGLALVLFFLFPIFPLVAVDLTSSGTVPVPLMGNGGTTGPQTRVLIAAARETVLSGRIAGYIQEITVGNGDWFRRGQKLVIMDCAIHMARKQKVEAELQSAQHTLAVQRQLENLKSGSALETSLAITGVAKSRADLAVMNVTLQMCFISAPFSGRVVERRAQPHQTITQGQPLLEILDDSSLEARLIVPSRWLSWLRPGLPFTIHLDETGQRYPATVAKIGARIDPASQSLAIIGHISVQAPELLAGMSGTAQFLPPPHE